MSSNKCDQRLVCFFIFNSQLYCREGEEHRKLLWYYPAEHSLDVKVRHIGFCEAVVRFTDSFMSKRSRFHCVSSTNDIQVYFQPEPGIYMGSTVSRLKPSTNGESHEYSLEATCQINLKCAYRMFRLFNGTFTDWLKSGSQEVLQEKLSAFFARFIPLLKYSGTSLLDIFEGLRFMNLDSSRYLRVQTLLNKIAEMLPQVRHTVFLYETQLICFTLQQRDMITLYRYLINNVLPHSLKLELQPQALRSATAQQQFGKFVIGPTVLGGGLGGGNKASVFIESTEPTLTTGLLPGSMGVANGSHQDRDLVATGFSSSNEENDELAESLGSFDEFQMIVYRVQNGTLCFLVPATISLDLEFFRLIDTAIGPSLLNLSTDIGQCYGQLTSDLPFQHHYIFFNSDTRSLLSTLPLESEANLPAGAAESFAVLHDLREQLKKSDYFGDVVVKLDADLWIAAKKAAGRELYVIVNQKNANMTDVSEEVKKLCTTHFNNMFLNE